MLGSLTGVEKGEEFVTGDTDVLPLRETRAAAPMACKTVIKRA